MIARYEQGSSYDDLAVWLFNTHHVEVSSSTAAQIMRLWGLRARRGKALYIYIGTYEPRLMQKVGRPRKASTNLNPFKQEMMALYEQGNSFATIRISLMDNHGVGVPGGMSIVDESGKPVSMHCSSRRLPVSGFSPLAVEV
jgi:hypothetical protein